MSLKLAAAITCALLLGAPATRAAVITGSFSGTMLSGTDTTGVFGIPGANLTNSRVTGVFHYDTGLFSQSVAGTRNTATGTGPGALTVTLTVNGFSHAFADNTSSGIVLDSAASQVILANASSAGTSVNENFSLEADDIFTPFITDTDLTRTFVTSDAFLNSTGSFLINDAGPNADAGGAFSIETIGTRSVATPEPIGLCLLASGLLGIAGARARRHASH